MDQNKLSREHNIAYRDEIMTRVRNREKITKEERNWLQSNPVYNQKYGPDALAIDILYLEPKTKYHVKLSFVGKKSKDTFWTKFTCVLGEGYIEVPNDPKKYGGEIYKLSVEFPKMEFELFTKNGLIQIDYTQFYFCEINGITSGVSGSTDPRLAMKKTILADTKILYSCKAVDSDDFESYQFLVEWWKTE